MAAKNVLVFRFSSLGDVALTVPVIYQVLQQNPEVKLTMVTPKFMHALFPSHDRLRLIDFDKKGKHKGFLGLISLLRDLNLKQYDAIADLHQVLRTQVLTKLGSLSVQNVSKIKKNRKARRALIQGLSNAPLKHTAEKYADVFRALGLKVDLDFKLDNVLFPAQPKKNAVGVAPFARHEGKRYPLDQMKEFVRILAQEFDVYIFGSAEELIQLSDWKQISNVYLGQNLTLRQELELIAQLQLMISMDSANMHLASLVGTPVVSVWGVTHPKAGFLGYGQSEEWIVQDESCTWRPTSIYGNTLGPKENSTGFANITPKLILNKVNLVLNHPHE